MYRCNKCNSLMIFADVIDIRGRKSTCLVCTYAECGHIYSKDRLFKKEERMTRERDVC